MEITSSQNPKIKQLIKLQQKSRERKNSGWFVVEGVQENNLALNNQYYPVQFFICDEIYSGEINLPKTETFHVAKNVYEKIAYRQSTGGIIGVYQEKNTTLNELKLSSNPLIVVLESVEKPGNLGAILRTCDAANVDAVVVCDPLTDFYNPNVVRSSVGTLFTNKLVKTSKENWVDFCIKNEVQILATFLRNNTQNFYQTNLQKGTALVFGTEATGLSSFWLDHVTQTIKIPMLGQVDSLNVSNAVAVCVYEAVRQRTLGK